MCDSAKDVLLRTGNSAVMWGDCHLLDEIARAAGMELWAGGITARHTRVLNALSRTPGDLVPKLTKGPRGRWVRVFRLADADPEVSRG